MPTVSIVYFSGHGHTERLAKAVARGAAAAPGTTVHLIRTQDADSHWDALAASDAIIFGSPTYMGSAAAGFKTFMDSTSRLFSKQTWKDKLAAGFTNSNSPSGDKLNTLIQLSVFAAQHGMVWVTLGLLPQPPDGPNRLGAFLGAMAQSLHGLPEDQAPNAVDLRTGELLGERVALAAARWVRGAV